MPDADRTAHLASLHAALDALDAGEPCPRVEGLPDAQRDRMSEAGSLRPWLSTRRDLMADEMDRPPAPRTATGYALWSALTRGQVKDLDPKDAGRLTVRAGDLIPETNPVLARLAAQAGIAVAVWFDAALAPG